MKLNIHNTLLAASALIIAASTSSCRKDLCYNHFPEAGVTLSYENEWGVTTAWDGCRAGMPTFTAQPTTICVRQPRRCHHGGLPPRRHHGVLHEHRRRQRSFGASVHSLLFYNNDTQYIILNDIEASLPSARATSTSRSRATLGELHAVSAPSIRPMCSMPPIRPKCPS